MKNYTFDFTKNTLTISDRFNKRAMDPTNKEYETFIYGSYSLSYIISTLSAEPAVTWISYVNDASMPVIFPKL